MEGHMTNQWVENWMAEIESCSEQRLVILRLLSKTDKRLEKVSKPSEIDTI